MHALLGSSKRLCLLAGHAAQGIPPALAPSGLIVRLRTGHGTLLAAAAAALLCSRFLRAVYTACIIACKFGRDLQGTNPSQGLSNLLGGRLVHACAACTSTGALLTGASADAVARFAFASTPAGYLALFMQSPASASNRIQPEACLCHRDCGALLRRASDMCRIKRWERCVN